jgi:hypothetical protein
MARGTTLSELVTMLRAEMGDSLQASLGLNTLESYKMRIRRQQERLYHDWDWPMLRGSYDVDMQEDERYYDFPVIPETLEKVEALYSGQWYPLTKGISGDEYSAFPTDTPSDPVQKWDYYLNPLGADSTVDNLQFEVWPMPATDDACTVRFWGKRTLPALTSDNDKAILDDILIVLYAAATLIKDAEMRKLKLAEADAHYKSLKKRIAGSDIIYQQRPHKAYAPSVVFVGSDPS